MVDTTHVPEEKLPSWRALLLILMFPFSGFFVWYGFTSTTYRWWSVYCPAGTLISGPVGSQTAWDLAMGLAIFGGTLVAAGLIVGAGLGKVARVASLSVLPAVPIAAFGGFSHYCATPDTMAVSPGLFSQPVSYSWSEIRRVTADCWYHRGFPHHNLVLETRDGATVDFGGAIDAVPGAYTRIGEMLRNAHFTYDNNPALAHCLPGDGDLFAKRPGASGKSEMGAAVLQRTSDKR